MDLKRREDTILSVTSITIAGIVVFILRDVYVEYAIYFGWVTIYVVHLVIAWVIMILILGKIKSNSKKN